MNNTASRRKVLQGVVASAIIVGFDLVNREWATLASAASEFESLPPLDGILYTDAATRNAAADDFGHLVRCYPTAVLKPGSVEDIVRIVQFARSHQLKVAARGQGHSTYGQPQVEAGIVIDMSCLNTIHDISAEQAEVDAGVLWSQLLLASRLAATDTPRPDRLHRAICWWHFSSWRNWWYEPSLRCTSR